MLFYSAFTAVCMNGSWNAQAIAQRISHALRETDDWIDELSNRIVNQFPRLPETAQLEQFLRSNAQLVNLKNNNNLRLYIYPLTESQPIISANLPQIFSTNDLADWLRVTEDDLEWFADRAALAADHPQEKLRHYLTRCVAKKQGGYRLLEAPKPTLKAMQRKIHDHMLTQLPTHPKAFGFLKNTQVLEHAQLHQNKPVVLKFDLQDCFLHVHGGYVYQAFLSLGFSEIVCKYLMGICTHRLSLRELKRTPLTGYQQNLAQQNHLPQGAPSSPLLSHFALSYIDKKLSALAQILDATYSRYADDIVISGGEHLKRQFRYLEQLIGAIVIESGFQLNFRKSRCMTQSSRQVITGVTVNQHCNISRREFDRFKAELTNCLRYGWQSQAGDRSSDYQAHLRGRLNWFKQVNSQRTQKLEDLFMKIDWR